MTPDTQVTAIEASRPRKPASIYDGAFQNDVTVHHMICGGATLEEIIIALVADKESLRKAYMDLYNSKPQPIIISSRQLEKITE